MDEDGDADDAHLGHVTGWISKIKDRRSEIKLTFVLLLEEVANLQVLQHVRFEGLDE